ncbi:hypothetical protein D030_1464B, partial [Vibrio parahaemolyticus AQ3810]|jgi:hypothetical protein
MTV